MKAISLSIMAVSVLMLAASSLFSLTGNAEAHERRNVQAYSFVVGWLTEPALVNQPNSIDLRVSRTSDTTPITGLNTTVKADVTSAGKTVTVPLAARFNTPGAYNGYLMPTRTGEYTFRFYGTIEGVSFDEKFTSGPNTFSSIDEPNAFPDPLASADSSESDLEQRVVTLEAASNDSGTSNSGVLVGIIGIVVGAAGLIVGGMAFAKAGKS